MSDACPCPEHGTAPCGRCAGCCGAEEYCCETPDLALLAWKRDYYAAEAKLEKVCAYLAAIRKRADGAPATSMALTYRFVADELENLIR
jgi:hypothetical protein